MTLRARRGAAAAVPHRLAVGREGDVVEDDLPLDVHRLQFVEAADDHHLGLDLAPNGHA